MKKIEHLLVDLDGTLVDSKEYLVRFEFILRFLVIWRNHGGPFKLLQALNKMKTALELESHRAERDLTLEARADQTTNDLRAIQAFASHLGLSTGYIEKCLNDSIQEIFPKLKKYFYPVPGAPQFIHWASELYPLILATNPVWTPEVVEMRLNWAGLELDLFHSFTHAKKMTSCKPHLSYYEELLQQEKLDPSTCLLIGNDMRKDGPAVHAGIRVFLLSDSVTATPIEKKGIPPGFLWQGNYSALQAALREALL